MSTNYIDTRDLYKRQQDLEDLKRTVESAAAELKEAEEAFQKSEAEEPDITDEGTEAWDKWSTENDDLEEAKDDAKTALDDAKEAFGPDEEKELAELDELESEITDWRHGNTMIPESSFEDYARQLADDLGAIPDENRWPCTCIDWEQAAKELAMDYSMVSYQGEDYYVRA